MNVYYSLKHAKLNLLALLILATVASSCEKTADPSIIKVSTTPITGGTPTTPGGGTTTPGGGTTTPGGGTTNPGGGTTTPGGGATTPGGGTTTPGGGTTTPGGGTTTPGGGTTTPGGGTTAPITANTSGNGGVAIGNSGSVIFTLKGTTYTLSNSPSYFVGANSAAGFTTVGGIGDPNSIIFLLGSISDVAGVFNVSTASITLASGASYTCSKGYVNYNTFSIGASKAVTKGTFDMIMINDADNTEKIKVGGSFNL